MIVEAHANPVRRPTPLSAVIVLTVLASFGTGIFWNGMPFVAEHDYGYTERANFILFTTLGLLYVITAMSAGKTVRTLESRVSARSLVAIVMMIQAIACVGPLLFDRAWIVWPVTLIIVWTSGYLWPIVESYLSAGRAGTRLRFSMGIWNVAWTGSVAVALLLMAPLLAEGERLARYAIVGLGFINLVAILSLIWFNRNPLQPGHDRSDAEVGPNYSFLLHAARILLPVSYLLVGMITPLLPYRLDALEVTGEYKTPVAATWMIARVVAILVMWRMPFWHGRWGTMLLGGGSMTIGFLTMLIAPNVWLMFVGLALFGAGQGIVYYAAIYYAMSIGSAHVEAAGKHEGLIGVGYAAGPALGLVTLWTSADPGVVVGWRIGTISVVMLVCGVLALRPYFASRRAAT